MQIPITPTLTLNMSANGTSSFSTVTPEQLREAQEELDNRHLEVLRCQQALKLARSLESGAEGRLITLRTNLAKQERERLVEQRQKLTAEEHNAFDGGRW